ncbi:Catechol 2,3-dioxygenase [Parapedobacter luteus]|uniref:Catechol 2,3-dioxygenase n=1 Tax=Parapedobacter luteus TaxID=623280 RepID=A0A1T5CFA3_9SPHI|nr:VOC family protein [Parapedobacter luteus]SKB58023.1 Catechol 2,3-dioxygenase [Parapedobacter luteus]
MTALQGIDTVIVRVSDIGRAKQWYQEKLGLTPVWEDTKQQLVVLDTGSPTSLTLWQTDKKATIDRELASYPIFRTTDAKLSWQVLRDKGADVGDLIRDDHTTYFRCYDPDGNVLEACQVHE